LIEVRAAGALSVLGVLAVNARGCYRLIEHHESQAKFLAIHLAGNNTFHIRTNRLSLPELWRGLSTRGSRLKERSCYILHPLGWLRLLWDAVDIESSDHEGTLPLCSRGLARGNLTLGSGPSARFHCRPPCGTGPRRYADRRWRRPRVCGQEVQIARILTSWIDKLPAVEVG